MYEKKNQQLIEAFSTSKMNTLMKRAELSFRLVNKRVDYIIKILNAISKRLENRPVIFGGKGKVIDRRNYMLFRLALGQILFLRRIIVPACIKAIYYSKQIKKFGPLIIRKELKNGNRKASRNFVLAAKLRYNTVKKALRDKKFANIRVKKIPRKKPKKEKKERIKKEKFTLNHHQMRRSQELLTSKKLPKVKYDYEPLKIMGLFAVMYVIFNYVYFKL